MDKGHACDAEEHFLSLRTPSRCRGRRRAGGSGRRGPAGGARAMRVELFEARHAPGRAGGLVPRSRVRPTGRSLPARRHGLLHRVGRPLPPHGMADCFQRHRRLHFIGPDGTRCDFAAAPWLPAPLHLLPGSAPPAVSLAGKTGCASSDDASWRPAGTRTEHRRRFASPDRRTDPSGLAPRPGESEAAIHGFWSVVLRSALAETVDRASFAAARKVFVDGFLASRRAYELEIPRMPLAEIFDDRLGAMAGGARGERPPRLPRHGRSRATAAGRVAGASPDGEPRREFDFFVVAVPWHRVGKLLAGPLLDAIPAVRDLAQIEPVPITAIHLWFDRPITELPHAVLVGRLSQWVFRGGEDAGQARPLRGSRVMARLSRFGRGGGGERLPPLPSCHQRLPRTGAASARGRARPGARRTGSDLAGGPQPPSWSAGAWSPSRQRRFPCGRESTGSGLRSRRPWPISRFAGDWTATGWPATMEGAVRSGYAAAEAVGKGRGVRG